MSPEDEGQFVPSAKQMFFEFKVVATLRLQEAVEHSVDAPVELIVIAPNIPLLVH
jgi:hypothetical protein